MWNITRRTGSVAIAVVFLAWLLLPGVVQAGLGEWTWMSGSDIAGQVGVYGTQGVTATTNVPEARQYSITWTDRSGKLWLFGGRRFKTPVRSP